MTTLTITLSTGKTLSLSANEAVELLAELSELINAGESEAVEAIGEQFPTEPAMAADMVFGSANLVASTASAKLF